MLCVEKSKSTMCLDFFAILLVCIVFVLDNHIPICYLCWTVVEGAQTPQQDSFHFAARKSNLSCVVPERDFVFSVSPVFFLVFSLSLSLSLSLSRLLSLLSLLLLFGSAQGESEGKDRRDLEENVQLVVGSVVSHGLDGNQVLREGPDGSVGELKVKGAVGLKRVGNVLIDRHRPLDK